MKKLAFIIVFAALVNGYAGTLSLFECYKKAENHHPLQKEISARRRIELLNRGNLNAGWLPGIHLNAGFNYMSDVAELGQVFSSLPLSLPGISLPDMPKDQYKATIDIRQTVFDGGAICAGKKLERASMQTDLKSIQTEIYHVRDQINQLYFSILAQDKNKELMSLLRDEVEQKKASLLSALQNGVVTQSDLDILDAELLKLDQQIIELDLNRKKAAASLEILLGEKIGGRILSLPSVEMPEDSTILRPELELFTSQSFRLEMSKKTINTSRIPKLFLYASYGYGSPPGNDFFNDQFDTYYTVGAGLTWNIFDWNSAGRTKKSLGEQQNRIEARREEFNRKITMALKNQSGEIEKLGQLIRTDEKLISLRHDITMAAASKLDNGVISPTDYLTELNTEHRARISAELHKIQLIMAKVVYLTLSGQIDEQLSRALK